jgi:hypothetical protein
LFMKDTLKRLRRLDADDGSFWWRWMNEYE